MHTYLPLLGAQGFLDTFTAICEGGILFSHRNKIVPAALQKCPRNSVGCDGILAQSFPFRRRHRKRVYRRVYSPPLVSGREGSAVESMGSESWTECSKSDCSDFSDFSEDYSSSFENDSQSVVSDSSDTNVSESDFSELSDFEEGETSPESLSSENSGDVFHTGFQQPSFSERYEGPAGDSSPSLDSIHYGNSFHVSSESAKSNDFASAGSFCQGPASDQYYQDYDSHHEYGGEYPYWDPPC